MPSTREPSLEELREEFERNREALTATVGELREKVGDTASELKTLVSPAHIKQEIKDYVREERESLVKSVQRKAKENPLQLAAIGAAVAYPAWGLLRAIPTPLLLIGAGLFLTSKRGQQSAKDIKAKVDDVVQQGTERVTDLAGSNQSDIEDRIAGARYGAEGIRDFGHIRRGHRDRQGTSCLPRCERCRAQDGGRSGRQDHGNSGKPDSFGQTKCSGR